MSKKEVTNKDLRQFGIVLALILGLFGFLHFRKGNFTVYPVLYGFSIVSMVLGIFIPRALTYVYKVFSKAAHAIGWFNTRVILVVIFYLVLTPIALVMKLLGKDPLNRKVDRSLSSYWITRDSAPATAESLKRQF